MPSHPSLPIRVALQKSLVGHARVEWQNGSRVWTGPGISLVLPSTLNVLLLIYGLSLPALSLSPWATDQSEVFGARAALEIHACRHQTVPIAK